MLIDSKHTGFKASFPPNSTELSYLQLAQVTRSPDLVIFMSMTTMIEPITLPLVHVHGVKHPGLQWPWTTEWQGMAINHCLT